MRKIRLGILSTANIARTQLIPAIKRSSFAEVTAIASSSEKAQQVAKQWDIPKVYEHYEELLQDPDIEAVYLPLPTQRQRSENKREIAITNRAL